MQEPTPAGWYPDPDNSAFNRYWDGAQWTEDRSPAQAAAPPVQQSPPVQQWGAQPPQQMMGAVGYPQQQMAVTPKNPAISLLISFFIPGVGSMVNGDVGKGAGILVGYCISIVLVIVLIGIPMMIGFWIWGMVDAYQGAQQWNAARGIVS